MASPSRYCDNGKIEYRIQNSRTANDHIFMTALHVFKSDTLRP